MILGGQPDPVQQEDAEARHAEQQNRKFSAPGIGNCKRGQHNDEGEPEQEVIRRKNRQTLLLGETHRKAGSLENAHNNKKPCAQPLPARIPLKAIRENKQQAQGI
ncbi:hypothetical protein D3C81_1992950 [compost metagenome]